VQLSVNVLKVLPESWRVEVGWDGLDEDDLVTRDQMQAGVSATLI
jgi:hypothetical protein